MQITKMPTIICEQCGECWMMFHDLEHPGRHILRLSATSVKPHPFHGYCPACGLTITTASDKVSWNQERVEQYFSCTLKRELVQYDFRTMDGTLFSCVADTADKARELRDSWLQSYFARPTPPPIQS